MKVLITGAGRRIGHRMASELADSGADVALHYHQSSAESESLLQSIRRRGRRAIALQADLADPSSWRPLIDRAVESLNGLTVLINNASLYPSMELTSFDLGSWDQTLRVNLTAPIALAHHAREHLRIGNPGRIINLCDALTNPDAPPQSGHLAYGASKAALHWLTRALARELAPDILVNGVAPGVAIFPDHYDETVRRRILDRVPLGRAGGADPIAKAVRYLVKDADYVTGQILSVSGGLGLMV